MVQPFCCHATNENSRRRYGAFGPSYSPRVTDRSLRGNEVRGQHTRTERFSAPVAYTQGGDCHTGGSSVRSTLNGTMMAMSMEADSQVLLKEKREGKGVKTETAVDDATLRFHFRASTPATSAPERGAEHQGGDGEEQRRIELKKFSLRSEKYYRKGDFEGWVNQFEEYATLGQWNEEEKASLFFLSLTAGVRMYFVGLPEREKMAYATRVEALRHRFGQETDTSIALQELAGLRRGKNQSAKELADSARRLASPAYHSNDYASQEKAALHGFQMAVGEDL